MADTSEDREFAAGHLAAAIEKRLYEIRDRDFLVGLSIDTTEPALSEAARLAMYRLCGVRFTIERVTQWGQRGDPPVRTFLRKQVEHWMEVRQEVASTEPIGIYLGNDLVLVVPPGEVSHERTNTR